MTLCWKTYARYKTSTHEEHFPCGTFSYQHVFVDEKLVQRGSRYKKSRCPWNRVYLRTSITLWALPSDKTKHYVEPAVNRQPGFRRKLVKQITWFRKSPKMFLHGELLKSLFPASAESLKILIKIRKFHHFFIIFSEHTQGLLMKVRSSTKADTHTKLNFFTI